MALGDRRDHHRASSWRCSERSAGSRRTRSRTASPVLHVVLPRHAADRPAVPDLPRAAADRREPRRVAVAAGFLTLTPFQAGIIGLALNYGAYMTEIFRAGIQSVGHGQAEAAEALGMSYRRGCAGSSCRRRCGSSSLRPATSSSRMMKDTALLAFLGVAIFWPTRSAGRRSSGTRLQEPGGADRRRGVLLGADGDLHVLPAEARDPDVSKGYVRGEVQPARAASGPSSVPAGPHGRHVGRTCPRGARRGQRGDRAHAGRRDG